MNKYELAEKIKQVKDLDDVDWTDCELLYFSDENADLTFRNWLKENEHQAYNEFLRNISFHNGINKDNFTIVDFFTYINNYTDDELIDILVDFVFENDDLQEELEDNVLSFLNIDNDDKYEYSEDEYDDYLKEDSYDDYDYYDDMN